MAQDREYDNSRLAFVEASRRLGDRFRLTVDARAFSGKDPRDFLTRFDQADYASVTLEYFY